MSRIQSSQGRNKNNSSIYMSNKASRDYSRSETIKRFNQEIPFIEGFITKENQDQLNSEQALTNFYEYALDSYKKKLYDNLLKELEMNKNLIYIGTKESFNIVIIKIKCLMKLMIEKYENDMNEVNDEQISVKEYIYKIQKEFLKINAIIKKDDYYENETITNIYCKFLIYLIKIIQKKEEYFKSLAYITLGINMIKIFFIKKGVAKNIKLYKRYIYLLILLINHLMGEGNFTQVLLYSNIILKIIETATKVLYNNNYSEKMKNKQIIEFIRCSGFVYVYIGLCYEIKKNQETAMEAYKQAFYFFMKLKSPKFHGIKLNDEKIFYDNNFVQISHWFLNKIRTRIVNDKRRRERLRMSILLERINEKENENFEKKKKLKLVSSGLNENQKKYNLIENKLYTTVLNSKNNKIIEKLDKALINLAYQEKKKPSQKKIQKKISYNIMETMCHYQIYNKLMTERYQEFLLNNKNIKLSNPKDEEDFIHKVNSYLTQNMEIKPQSSRKNKSSKSKTDKFNKSKNLNKNSLSSSNFFNNKGLGIRNFSAKTRTKNDLSYKNQFDIINDDILHTIKSSKKLSFKKNFDFSSLKLDIPVFSNNLFHQKMTKSLSDIYLTSKTLNPKANRNKPKLKLKKDSNKTWSKNIYLNPKYFKRYMNLEKLIKKELNFQKDILNLKSNNCKLYHNSFAKEIFVTGKDKEEERNQDYMILTEKIDQKVLNNQKEYEKLIYFNIKKKKGNNKFLKNKNNNSDDLDEEILGINKKLNLEDTDTEEEKNFNEINKKSLFSVNEKLKNIIYKMRERRRLLKEMKNKKLNNS